MNVLLHICCGPCATEALRSLMLKGHKVKGFFYGPNIHPQDEYELRKAEAGKVCSRMGVELICGSYDRQRWFQNAEGNQNEPEGGDRCEVCFYMRLEETYKRMERERCDRFASTLSISPHKNASLINSIGYKLGGERYMPTDFKKKGGYLKSVELSKKMDLYRQNYCGCIYSLEASLKRCSGERVKDER